MVKHILKDGTILNDIKGHVVKAEELPEIYKLIEIKRREQGNE